MAYWCGQHDVPHSFTAYFSSGHLDTTLIADNALKSYFLIFATGTFEVFGWAKNTLAEKAILFWL